MNFCHKYLSACLLALVSQAAFAQSAPTLGAAAEFSVLGGTAVTCTDAVITGDVGISPGSAFTNTRCTIAGDTPPATNADAVQARTDFLSAYTDTQSAPCSQTLTGTLDGVTLAPGVYCFEAAATLTGTLTLDGPATGIWIFKIGAALTTTDFTVVMAGGGQPCNVYWVPGAAATMTTSAFKGTVLAGDPIDGSITTTGGTLAGRILANVAVTITGTGIIDCGVLSDSPSCKPKKHHKHGKCRDGHDNGHGKCHDRDDHDKDHKSDHHHGSHNDHDDHDGKDGKGGKGGRR